MAVKEEILEGLRVAIAKGEPFRKAMMSFYNAGYSKQDIEDSARALQTPQLPQTQPQPKPQPVQQPVMPQPTLSSIPKALEQQLIPPANNTQLVSDYEKKPRSMSWIITFILIFLLLVLLAVLAAVFLFRDEIADIFSSLLSLPFLF